MTKTTQRKTTTKSSHQEKQVKPLIPEKYQNALYIGLIVLAVFVFFGGAIFGGGFSADDNIASDSFKTYLNKANKDNSFPLWVPYIFGGMPSYASLLTTGARVWDFLQIIFFSVIGFAGTLFGNDVARVVCYYAIYGIGVYLLMLSQKHERFVAFFSAVAAMFSTYVITWVMIGHNTKPVVFATLPFIFLLVEKLREKFSLLYAVLLAMTLHIMMEGGHLQLIFYIGCAVGLYLVYELISRLILKTQPVKIVAVSLILVVCGGLAFLMSSDRYLSTWEYTPYSTRGSAPIVKSDKQHQDASGGNDYEYATMWSYSPEEAINFFIPGYFGNGVRKYTPADRSGAEPIMFPTYWGQKESEDSPPYMGIGVLALALLGFIVYRKNVFVQFLTILCIFSVLLSFGKNLPLLYDFFFYHIPSFNKFRAPSMALALMHFAVPVMSGFGLAAIFGWRKEFGEKDKKILKGFIIGSIVYLGIGLLFALLFKGTYVDAVTNSPKISRYLQYFQDLPDFIWSSMIGDWILNGVLVLALFSLAYMYLNRKLTATLLYPALIALLLIDLWRVDYRRMEIPKQKAEDKVFAQYRDVYKPLQQDTTLFRVADFSSQQPNVPAYYLMQNINGYHAAKLRVYQDLMDVTNTDGNEGSTSILYNPFLWNLLNVKYIIAPGQNQKRGGGDERPVVYPNPTMYPRAFFVKNAVEAKPMDILTHLKKGDFNPLDTAFVEEPLAVKLDTVSTESKVTITQYKNEYIKAEATTTGNNLLFFSEVYYPVSWKAYIDGTVTPIYKTNYAFRSIVVPPGKHTIEMKFVSEKFETGKSMSLIVNIAMVLIAAVGCVLEYRKKKENKDNKNAGLS